MTYAGLAHLSQRAFLFTKNHTYEVTGCLWRTAGQVASATSRDIASNMRFLCQYLVQALIRA